MAAQTQTKPRTENTTAKPAPTGNLPAAQQTETAAAQFRKFVDQRMDVLKQHLPPTITPEEFISVVMVALQQKPDLLKCTQRSLWNACLLAAQQGLLPDGREGAIAPYGQNDKGTRVAEIATWMPMIGGYRKLAREGGVLDWHVYIVNKNDEFDFELGDDPFIKHRPFFNGDPGPIVGAYSIAKLPDGALSREVMSKFEMDKIRAKSKALTNGPWSDGTFEGEMYKKTIGRRHYKQLPQLSALSRLSRVIDHDDNEFGSAEIIDEPRALPRPAQRQVTTGDTLDHFAGGGAEGNAGTKPDVKGDQAKDVKAGEAAAGAVSPAAVEPAADELKMEDDTTESTVMAGESHAASDAGPQLPANEREFRVYFAAELEKIDDARKVVEWFNSPEQKELREKCGMAPFFQDLMRDAGDRRTYLTQQAAGTTNQPWGEWLAQRRK